MAAFTWGAGGQKITTPEQARNARKVAEALMNQGKATNWGEGLARVAGAFSANALNDRAALAETEGAQSAAAALAGLGVGSDPNAIIGALSNPWLSQPQASVASALLTQGLEQQDPLYQARLAKLQADVANGGQGKETFFGNVVPMQDANGNIVLGQASNQGRWQPFQGADGYTPAPTTKQIDTGTEIITTDVYGNELYRTPKQNRQAAYDTSYGGVEGKNEAENDALRQSISSKLPGLRSVVDTLTQLADTATYTQSGQIMDSVKRELGLPVGQGAIDRASYIAIVDNQVLPLLRDTFGAAFTQKEGETLRATLGAPNVSPAEKKAILEAFISQKERDILGMESNMPGGSPTVSPAPTVRVFNPATGRLE